MSGRYNFEFYRHICGRTLSIHDTEPCECEIRKARYAQMQKLSPTTKSLCRLLRRARAHGLTPWHIIRTENGGKQATVLFAGRHIRVRDDGSLVPDMLPRWSPDGTRRTDPHWEASMYARMYEHDMAHAAYCRRMRWDYNARNAIRDARVLRGARLNG